MTQDTRLALVNAIYLKASWAQAFQEDQTNQALFTRPDGSTVTVPLMRVRGASCGQGDGWAAADIPYFGRQLSMLVIVPDDLSTFERTLDADVIAAIDTTIAATTAIADVTLPRFDLETRELLGEILADLGMPTAFDPATADFSGMTSQTRLVISKVIHQANISVDEKGTEAAAVTVVGMDTTGGHRRPARRTRIGRSCSRSVMSRPARSCSWAGSWILPRADARRDLRPHLRGRDGRSQGIGPRVSWFSY